MKNYQYSKWLLPVETTLETSNKMTLVSFSPTRNCIVLLRSSLGRGVFDDLRRPPRDTGLQPRQGRSRPDGGEYWRIFMCTQDGPMASSRIFQSVINVASNNAHVFMKRDGYTKSKKEFLREMFVQLASSFARKRHLRNQSLQRHVVNVWLRSGECRPLPHVLNFGSRILWQMWPIRLSTRQNYCRNNSMLCLHLIHFSCTCYLNWRNWSFMFLTCTSVHVHVFLRSCVSDVFRFKYSVDITD